MSIAGTWPARAVIDLDAVEHNAAQLVGRAAPAQLMAVVKANAYGHGLVPVARAALRGGATWLGVAQGAEALTLRNAGVEAPILAWLFGQQAPYGQLIDARVDLGVSTLAALEQIRDAASSRRHTTPHGRARLHLKLDTGLARNGLLAADFPQAVELVAQGVAAGVFELVGLWSHLTHSDEPGHPDAASQRAQLDEALQIILDAGLPKPLVHLANSAATLLDDSPYGDLVRAGLALYGLSPVPQISGPEKFDLRPAMRLESEVANVKRLAAGQGVSYNHTYRTPGPTTVLDVPLGYADGIPRQASSPVSVERDGVGAPVLVRTAKGPVRGHVVGRVCMDQTVVGIGPDVEVALGDTVVLFGDPARGEPSAQEWAEAAGTISYTIVTGIGTQVPRVYEGGSGAGSSNE